MSDHNNWPAADMQMTAYTFGVGGATVNEGAGVIHDAAIVSVGPALGHGVELEQEFVDKTCALGNATDRGVKVRFGHPSMSSTALGTFMGRAKNFRVDGPVCRADIFLSRSAKEAPGGDLYSYVLGLAEDEPDMFGMSIVFQAGTPYQYDDDGERVNGDSLPGRKIYATNERLRAVDFVDDPAANANGLFSAFDSGTIAQQVAEFLDTHPQIWELCEARPDIIEGFMARYQAYRIRFDAALSNDGSDEPSHSIAPKGAQPKNEDHEMDREQFAQMVEEFGSEIATQVMLDGGDMDDARALKAALDHEATLAQLSALQEQVTALEAERDELRAKLAAITKGEDDAATVDVTDEELSADDEPEPVDCSALIAEYMHQGLSAVDAQNKVLADHPEEFKKQFSVGG